MQQSKLKRDDGEAGNKPEMPKIDGCHRVPMLQRACSDQQVNKGDDYALRRLFSVDPSSKHGRGLCVWNHFHVSQQILDKAFTALAEDRGLRTPGSMNQFGETYCGECSSLIAYSGGDLPKKLRHSITPALRSNDNAGIEDQSHRFSSGSGWLLMTASRSRPKSPSNVTVEPRASADARDSESRRPGPGWVAARRTTAMARASESITTSSPARTRASRPAKSRTASASEMWTTAIVTMIPAVYSECHQYPRPHPPGRPGVQLENRLSQGDAMSDLAANPAVVPDPILHMMTRTNESLCPRSDGGGVRSSIGSWTSRMARANRAARTANFFDQGANENFAPACVCRFVSRLCLGHGFGACHAPGGTRSSASTSPPQRAKNARRGPRISSPFGSRFLPEQLCKLRPRAPRKLLPGPSQKAARRRLGAWPTRSGSANG